MNLKNRNKVKVTDKIKPKVSGSFEEEFVIKSIRDGSFDADSLGEVIVKLKNLQDKGRKGSVNLGLSSISFDPSSNSFNVSVTGNLLGSFPDAESAVSFVDEDKELNPKKVNDADIVERKVGKNVFKAKKFNSAEEANKFLEQNDEYDVIDIENDEVFVALREDKGKPTQI